MSIYDSKAQTKIPFTSSTSIREIFEHSIAKFEISGFILFKLLY